MEEEGEERPFAGAGQASTGPFTGPDMEIDMIDAPPLASQWAPDVFAALQAPPSLVPQHATLQQQGVAWVPCTEVGGSEFRDGSSCGGDGGGASRLTPAVMAEKLAAAREKNRLAQQRFRERQRAKQREADDAEAALLRELDEVRVLEHRRSCPASLAAPPCFQGPQQRGRPAPCCACCLLHAAPLSRGAHAHSAGKHAPCGAGPHALAYARCRAQPALRMPPCPPKEARTGHGSIVLFTASCACICRACSPDPRRLSCLPPRLL